MSVVSVSARRPLRRKVLRSDSATGRGSPRIKPERPVDEPVPELRPRPRWR